MTHTTELESQLLSLLAKLDASECYDNAGTKSSAGGTWSPAAMLAEIRTLDLWRSVIGECLASVFYVLLVCGAYSPWAGQPTPPERHLVISLVAGFAMTILVHCFAQVSGGHINPAVTISLTLMRRVSPLKGLMFVLAQLGGGIAGAALLFGVTSSGYTGDLGATTVSRMISGGQAFGVEFLLSFVVVLAYCSALYPHRRGMGDNPACIVGLAYLATTLVGLPLTGASMNPARSLGPAFVMNNWDKHWVYWAGPILGGSLAGFIHEFIFNPRRSPLTRNSSGEAGGGGTNGADTGVGINISQDDDILDIHSHLHRQNRLPPPIPPHSSTSYGGGMMSVLGGGDRSTYNAMRRHNRGSTSQHTQLYMADNAFNCEDNIYSGSKSLYTPSARGSNLHRSHSVVYNRPLPVPNGDQKLPDQQYGGYQQNVGNPNIGNPNMVSQSYNPHQIPNDIDKVTTSANSNYSKNISSEHQMLQQQQANIITSNKSNIIKPEPVYKTKSVSPVSNNHNQNMDNHMQNLVNNANNHNIYHRGDRCGSVLSTSTTVSSAVNNTVKYHPDSTDDNSGHYNYRGPHNQDYGRNRMDLSTPGSIQCEINLQPSSFSHYGINQGTNKQY